MNLRSDKAVDDLWRRRRTWSRVADAQKAGILRARLLVFLLGAGGALLGTLAATVLSGGERLAVALTGAGLLAGIGVIRSYLLTQDRQSAWTRARSASEGLKSELYRFRAEADPYDTDDRLARLMDECAKIERNVEDLAMLTASIAPVDGKGPPALPGEAYVQQRVRQQIDGYYWPSARSSARRSLRLRRAEIAIALFGAVLGAFAGVIGSGAAAGTWQATLGAWVAVSTTIGGTVAAHAAASRYDLLAMSYAATARRLEELLLQWQVASAPAEGVAWSAFVNQCEDAISVENESWMAKWTEPVKAS